MTADTPPGSLPSAPSAHQPARLLDLRAALRLAFANNRNYQSEKESVYLAALTLTLAQHQFAPRFFGIVTGEWNRDSNGAESGTVSPSFGWDMLLVNGARLSISVAQNFFQFFTGDRQEVANTIIDGTLTQPLLRGFGTEIAREPLTQTERNLTYQIRAFERFRKTFSVAVITEYYRVLEARDRVTNSYLNWQSLVTSRDRIEALANAQKRPPFEVGQARQDELRAQDEWNSSVERYESALDQFKITLGISTGLEIVLQQGELDELAKRPVVPVEAELDDAIASALELRLDLQTVRDQLVDAERRIRIAADELRTQLDVNAKAALQSTGTTSQTPLKFNADRLVYGFGFDLDLPFDRKAERNAYVAALIDRDSERRGLSLFEDTVRLTVRDAYRRLDREIVSYRIQKISMTLAEERVNSTTLFLQAGRAETRDLLDAQASLNLARNAVTSALINYAVARLELLRDAEALRVTDDGQVVALPIGRRPDARA
jgi:outer membrane protein TolC